MDAHMSGMRAVEINTMPRHRKQERTIGSNKTILREYKLQERETALLNLIQRYPNQVVRGLAMRNEAEWHYGRLYLVGAITRQNYEAACHLDKTTRAYQIMIRRYGHVQSARYEQGSSSTTEDLSKSAQKRCKKIKEKYDAVYGALRECGEEVEKAVVETLRQDVESDLELLRRGLTVIEHFIR